MSVLTASTIDHADYESVAAVTPAPPQLVPEEVSEADIQRISAGEEPSGDPQARQRLAQVLYRITGWEIFGDGERSYVSRLWAEDWDSPEDAIYDQ